MKINLNEQEIFTAIEEYISNQGIDLSEKKISIDLTAGRKPTGFYADILIGVTDADVARSPFTAENCDSESAELDQPALDLDTD